MSTLKYGIILALTLASIGLATVAYADEPTGPEANVEIAYSWWPPLHNVWTPIGWKGHLFRFNVVHDGRVVALPQLLNSKKCTRPYAEMGVQLTFTPSGSGAIPEQPTEPYYLYAQPDGGLGNQGWTDNPTPVLWTEWPIRQGLVLRKEIFGHVTGGGEVKTGIEPLYAWIRLSVRHVDELQAAAGMHFMIQLSKNYVMRSHTPVEGLNLRAYPDQAPYHRPLSAKSFDDAGQTGLRILEQDGRVRLVVLPSKTAAAELLQSEKQERDYYLKVLLPGKKGAHVDLLLPMLPSAQDQVDSEMSLGFESALADADRYWSAEPATSAHIDTPEKWVNEAIRYSVKLAEVVAETNPETGECTLLTGSWYYARLWSTPASMTNHMLLDNLGYHKTVEKYSELFKAQQGTVKPPGPAYELHPGYFSSPKTLTAIDWLTDHGAILHQVARHALLSGDEKFIARWLDAIIKGCDFIKDSRAITDHDGVAGSLPPAVATDRGEPTQSIWNMSWNYKGLTSAVRLLKRIGHPRAEEFAAEARDFKANFAEAFRKAAADAPKWTDRSGRKRVVTPGSLNNQGPDPDHVFYLDAGPMVAVWAGLMDADDELMRSAADFLREGPNVDLLDRRGIPNAGGTAGYRPVLIHEISSCEPCYSWNIYHSWQLADRYRFCEGMYSLLTGSISSQTYIGGEWRHGIYGIVIPNAMFVDLARLSVVDDVIVEDELHLLRLVPLAWVKTDYETKFENMPTEFGPMTVKFWLSDDGKGLEVTYKPEFRVKPNKVVLHVPPIEGVSRVIVNKQKYAVQSGGTVIIK